jgi:hypothetical protein
MEFDSARAVREGGLRVPGGGEPMFTNRNLIIAMVVFQAVTALCAIIVAYKKATA